MTKLMTVAEFLGKPPSWVYDNWRREALPFKKVGQALRCRPTDLERWFDNRAD
ncbi:helix-turn-helix domain-containing protein [Streptomyces varsoviensis]|uniref:helix-turn-helix domain-containing protein n=1 Tax=Streptomyces varsoviensis TaxID=67373 RepID=UPI0033C3DC85